MLHRIRVARKGIGSRLSRRVLEITVTGLLAGVWLSVAASSASEPLHVLLTNDDGYRAPGIIAVHNALLDAGFRVTVVAPKDQQSGSSMRVSIGQIAVEQVGDNFWAVSGTPADSVSWALNTVLRDDRPDIVVSGANFGQNLGGNTNLSGTVGAAIMATQLGVPAVAVSVGIDLAERKSEPVRYPTTAAAFPRAAAFTVALLKDLVRTAAGGPLLAPHRLLNVNYPALPAAGIKGVRTTRVAHTGGFEARFVEPEPDGTVRIDLEHSDPVDAKTPGGDTELFAAGYVTVSVIDAALDAGDGAATALENRLGDGLDAFVRAGSKALR